MKKYNTILGRLNTRLYVFMFIITFLGIGHDLTATHIVGGDITYSCISPGRYEVTLTVRRDCFFGEDDAPLDDPASIGIFDKFGSRLSYIGDFGQFLIPLVKNDTLNDVLLSDCTIIGSPVCVQEGVYKDTVYLPYLEGGYFLAYQRCCRNQSLLNIIEPLETGSSYYVRITDEGQNSCNSSPVFKNWADIYICAGETMVFDHSATDSDGDSLVYSLNVPNSGATFDDPMPQPPDNPPYDHVTWHAAYSVDNMMGGIPLQIDANTGVMTATPNFIGQYLIGVRVEEYREGELISIVRRDFEYNVRACGIGPEAAFEIAEFECGDLEVSFVNQSQNADFVRWYFNYPGEDPAFVSSEENPVFNFPDYGSYTIRLEAFRALDGCRTFDEQELIISPEGLNINFGMEIDSCQADGFVINLVDLTEDRVAGQSIISQMWTVITSTDTLSGIGSPIQFNVANADSVEITLLAGSSRFCTQSLTKTEVLDGMIPLDFEYDVIACDESNINIELKESTSGYEANSWNWTLSNSDETFTGTGNPLQLSLPGEGEYQIILNAELSNGCTGFIDQSVDIELPYMANYDLQITECRDDGILIQLSNSSENIPDNVGIETTNWIVSGSDEIYSANGEIVELLLATEGEYQIELVVELDNGCAFSLTDDVNISLHELFPIDFNYQVSACTQDGLMVQFSASDLDLPDYVSVISWNWQFSGQGVTMALVGTNPNVNLPIAGSYSIELTATLSNNCIVSILRDQDIGLNDYGIGFNLEITGCENGEIQLQLYAEEGNIPIDLGPDSWNWTVDDGQNQIQTTGLNPVIVVPAEGQYLISLEALLKNTCTSVYTESIDIEFDNYGIGFNYLISDCSAGKVLLQFTAEAGSIPANLMPVDWEWTVENTFETVTGTGSNASIGLSTDGEYLVTLKAILADGCPATYQETINIDLPEYNTDFSFEVLDCAAGDVIVHLHANAGDIPPELSPTDWLWYITDASGSVVEASGANPQVLLDGPGNYSIELIAILANECPSSNTLDLQIELETYDFGFSYEQVGCVSEQIILSLTPDDTNIPSELLPVGWEWIITGEDTDIQTAGDNPEISLPGPGDYIVILTAILSNDCPASNEIQFSIDYEDYNIGLNYDHTGCNGDEISILFSPDYSSLPNGLDPVTWAWSISDGIQIFVSNEENPDFELPAEGLYTVNLEILLSNGCTASFSDVLNILASEYSSGFSFEAVSCEDEDVDVVFHGNIDEVPTSLSAVNWEWVISNDDGFTIEGTGQDPQFNLSLGRYNVALTVTLSNGCLAVINTIVNIENRLFDAAFDYVISGCFGDGLRVNLFSLSDAYPDGITAVDWSWQISNGNGSVDVNGENPFIILQTQGEYTVSLEVILSNGCLATIEELIIFEAPDYLIDFEYEFAGCDPEGAINISLSSLEEELPDGINIVNWIWIVFDLNDSQIFVEPSPMVTLAQLGIYTVELQAVLSNGCQTTFSKDIVVEMPNYLASFDLETFGCEAENPSITLIGSVENLLASDMVTNWDWLVFNNQDSISASGLNPTIILNDNGTYTIELVVTLENGCEFFYSDEINLEDLEYTIDYSYRVLECTQDGFLVHLVGDPGNIPSEVQILNWTWEITTPDGILSIQGIETDIILPEEGSYPISISVVLSNGCKANLNGDFVFDSGFDADFVFQVMSCEGDGILFLFNDNSAGLNPDNSITDWNWTFSYEDQVIEMEGNEVNILIPEGVNLNVQLKIVLDNGCMANYEETLPVILDLMAAFEFEVKDCNLDSVSLTLWDASVPNSLGLSPIEFLWTIQLKDETLEFTGDTIQVSVDSTDFMIIDHTVLFDNGCQATIEEALAFEFPDFSFETDTIAKCGLNPVALLSNPNPDWSYTWTPMTGLDFGNPPDFSNPLANPDTTTSYSVFVENEFCNAQAEITVVVGDNIELNISGNTDVCSEEEVLLEVSGAGVGAVYMWSDDQNFTNILSQEENLLVSVPVGSQTFYVTSEPDGLCAVGVDSITVNNQSMNLSISGNGAEAICVGDTIDLVLISDNPNQVLELQWENDPHIISALDSSIVQIIAFDTDDTIRLSYTATNQFDCTTSGSIEIPIGLQEELPSFQMEAEDCGSLIICFETSADDGTIQWDFGDINTELDSSSLASVCYEYPAYGNYTVSLNSASAFCGFSPQQFDLEVGPVLELELSADSTGYCAGDEISLTVNTNNNNVELIWEDASGTQIGEGETISYDGPGNQFLTVYGSSNGCLDTTSIYLDDYTFDVEAMPVDLICKGQETQVQIVNNSNDPLTFSWQPLDCIVSGGDTNSPSISVNESKDLVATITNTDNGCITEVVIPIDIIDFEVIIDAIPDQVINLGESVDLEVNGALPADEYEWSTGETDPIITVSPVDTSMYYVTVTNEFGCEGQDSILISVRQPLCNEEDVFLPSAFTPNGDNINDILFLRSNFVLLMELIVYDRWGEEVFISTDINTGWNGRYKNTGEMLAPDVYAYSLKVTCINDFTYIVAGNVSLLR